MAEFMETLRALVTLTNEVGVEGFTAEDRRWMAGMVTDLLNLLEQRIATDDTTRMGTPGRADGPPE